MAVRQVRGLMQFVRRLARPAPGDAISDRQLLREFADGPRQESFANLVARHGPMVWSVCRRVLRHDHDAEDAFQATFLILARRAGSVRWRESAAGWLYEVARRVAENARRSTARRRVVEQASAVFRTASVASPLPESDISDLLAEELACLPEKYRTPLVICYLEGLSHPEAARQLGWPVGTVKGRLARAREALRKRLTHRGVTAPAVILSVLTAARAVESAPARIVEVTANVAAMVASGSAPITGQPALLAEGVLRTMLSARLKPLAALAFLLLLTAAGASLASFVGQDSPPAAAKADPNKSEDHASPGTSNADEPLPAGAIARLGTRRLRHGGHVSRVVFTPDGKSIVSQSFDGVRVWDAATGREIRHFAGDPRFSYGSADVSRDGKYVVTPHNPGRHGMRLWDLNTGKMIREFPTTDGSIGYPSARFSPDGKKLVAFKNGPVVTVWDVSSGKRLSSLTAASEMVWSAAFTVDGKQVITGGDEKEIRVWDAATGTEVRSLSGNPNQVGLLAMSPRGDLLASMGQTWVGADQGGSWPHDSFVRIWDFATGKELRQIHVPATPADKAPPMVWAIDFSRDGKSLIMTSSSFSLDLRDPYTGKQQCTLPRAGSTCFDLAPDGNRIAIARMGSAIHVLDVRTGEDLVPLAGHDERVTLTALSQDGSIAVTGGLGPQIHVWDVRAAKELRHVWADERGILALALGDHDRTIISVGTDRTLRTWELATGRELSKHAIKNDGQPLLFAWPLSSGGKVLAAIAADGSSRLVDTATGKEIQTLKGQSLHGGAFAHGGDTFIGWASDQMFRVWDVRSGREVRSFPFDNRAAPDGTRPWYVAAAASPDGKLVAAVVGNKEIVVHDTAAGREFCRWGADVPGMPVLTFSPDSRTIAIGRQDSVVILYEVATGKVRRTLTGHVGAIRSLVFSQDNRLLLSGSEDTTALVWDLSARTEANDRHKLSTDTALARVADLASDDAAKAYAAITVLAANPDVAVPLLRKLVPPIAALDKATVRKLVTALDSDQFAEREKAAEELTRFGDAAVPPLRKALEGSRENEARRRIRKILDALENEAPGTSAERIREVRVFEALEKMQCENALQLLREIAKGVPEVRRTQEAEQALARIAVRMP